jgi:hypothetical protein
MHSHGGPWERVILSSAEWTCFRGTANADVALSSDFARRAVGGVRWAGHEPLLNPPLKGDQGGCSSSSVATLRLLRSSRPKSPASAGIVHPPAACGVLGPGTALPPFQGGFGGEHPPDARGGRLFSTGDSEGLACYHAHAVVKGAFAASGHRSPREL